MNGPVRTYDWPSLMVHEWTATRDTLHMWAEIVGKIRMVRMPRHRQVIWECLWRSRCE
jgi:hypothetical protein